MTISRGPFEEDVYFVLTYDDGSNSAIPLGEAADLLPWLQELPGFDKRDVHPRDGSQCGRHIGVVAPVARLPRAQQISALYCAGLALISQTCSACRF